MPCRLLCFFTPFILIWFQVVQFAGCVWRTRDKRRTGSMGTLHQQHISLFRVPIFSNRQHPAHSLRLSLQHTLLRTDSCFCHCITSGSLQLFGKYKVTFAGPRAFIVFLPQLYHDFIWRDIFICHVNMSTLEAWCSDGQKPVLNTFLIFSVVQRKAGLLILSFLWCRHAGQISIWDGRCCVYQLEVLRCPGSQLCFLCRWFVDISVLCNNILVWNDIVTASLGYFIR